MEENHKSETFKSKILEGFRNGIVKLVQDPNAGLICQIGDYYLFNLLDSKDKKGYTQAEITDQITDAMIGLDSDHIDYIMDILEVRSREIKEEKLKKDLLFGLEQGIFISSYNNLIGCSTIRLGSFGFLCFNDPSEAKLLPKSELAIHIVQRLIDDAFDSLDELQMIVNKAFEKARMREVKIGDYINGKIVEEISVIDGERYYLVTYFDKEIRKPQSKAIPEHEVSEYVSAEDFRAITRDVRKDTL